MGLVKIRGVSTCSRNMIIDSYRSRKAEWTNQNAQREKELLRWKHMRVTSLAVMKRPDLMPRGRGKLHWEDPADVEDLCGHP